MRTSLLRWIIAVVVTVPLCLICALYLDVPLARLAMTAPPGLRDSAQVFSDFGLSGYMLAISGLLAGSSYLLVRFGQLRPATRRALALIGERAFFVFSAVGVSGLLVQIIKHVVGRARPKLLDTLGAFHFDHFSIKASLASFPSGHSTSIFALAAALSLIVPRARVAVFLVAILVGAARAVLAAHYTSDIVAGAMLGTVTTVCLAIAFADRSIAFTRRNDLVRLKGAGSICPARTRFDGARKHP